MKLSEEKELNQIEDDEPVSGNEMDGLGGFVELDDLQSLEGLDDLSGLGDLSDLGDLGDLSDLSNLVAQAQPNVEAAPITDIDETEEADKADDISLDIDIPGLEDIADIEIEPEMEMEEPAEEELAEPETVDILEDRFPEENPVEESAGNEDIDSMLEGLLDSLDVNGSIDVPEDEEDTSDEESVEDIGIDIGIGIDGENTEDFVGEPMLDISIDPEDMGSSSMENLESPTDKQDADSLLDDLMISHDPDFMDAIGLYIDDGSSEETLPDDEQEQKQEGEQEEKKKRKEKKKKRLRKEKEELEKREKENKPPGFFKRLFGNVVTEEIADAERQAKLSDEEKAKLKAEAKAKALEEKKAKKAAQAEENKLKKEENAAKKAAKAEENAAKKAEKAAAKAAKKAAEQEEAEKEIVGKLNKAGVTVVVIFTALMLAGIIVGTNIFGYRLTKSETDRYFKLKKYTDAYKEVAGSKVKDKEPDEYEKIMTVMTVQQSLNTYNNYTAMKYYPDALNALLRGLQKYDENIEKARDLEVDGDLDACKDNILSILKDEFGLSESSAYAILRLNKESYVNKVVSIAKKKI